MTAPNAAARASSIDSDFAAPQISSMDSIDELTKIMAEKTLEEGPRQRSDLSTKLVQAYLIQHEPAFARVLGFRNKGWTENKEKGDAFFQEQRAKADNAEPAGESSFYAMMIDIAAEMNRMTSAFSVILARGRDAKVLDICAAPGGYTTSVLKHNPKAQAFAITLPVEQGGHDLLVEKKRLAGLQFLDVTMLAAEFSNAPIPQGHPERGKFLLIRPFRFHKFDLVFCDGIVLRTQKRESHRETTEVTRLCSSQLILALQRIKVGGTIIVLLHKIDSFGAANILYTFSKFANVQTFKPQRKHATRSSFYMVATAVEPENPAAKIAVARWKDDWWKATCGGEAGAGEPKEDPPKSHVLSVLEEFGSQLMELGRPIWRIQADALSKTEYAGNGSLGAMNG